MPESKLPPIEYMVKLRESGLTDQQIADHIKTHLGTSATRQAISTAFYRAGLTEEQPRYDKTLPWKIKTEHAQHSRARILRFLGRRLADRPLSDDQNQRVDSLLRKLERDNAVIVYIPDTEKGFYEVDRDQAIKEYGGQQPDESIPLVILPGDELRV